MKRYVGHQTERSPTGGRLVEVIEDGGERRPLNPRNELYNHSPNGFEWGYGGSGPAQLALAILADHLATKAAETLLVSSELGDPQAIDTRRTSLADRAAVRLHQDFKFARIAPMEQACGFELTDEDVSTFVASAILKRGGH